MVSRGLCKRLNYLIGDERKAEQEYTEFWVALTQEVKPTTSMFNTVHKIVLDESSHHAKLKKLKKTLKC